MADDESLAARSLVEPLTRREHQVLALLAEGYSGPEIAEELTLALSSVKSHVQHLYGKLGVRSKRQALTRATQLGLLGNGLHVPTPTPAMVTLQGAGSRTSADSAAPSEPAPSDLIPSSNLPVQITRFFGREGDIAQVRTRLAEWRLVTLTGSGGVGKTRLALAVAEAAQADFPDGVWFVELAPISDPTRVVMALAAVLGVSTSDPTRPILERLAQRLHDRQALLVLDNCEHLLEAVAPLAEALLRACPRLRILTSSRETLGVAGEAVYIVPSLPFPDPGHLPALEHLDDYTAVSLFVDRARAVAPGYQVTSQEAKCVARICQRLDGIPLALELAAARMRLLDTETIAARLDDAFQVLTGGSRTALPRHQTLRATIDWSYQLLSEPERRLLRRLSVFAGGWTLAAAEAVCSGDGQKSAEVLERLAALVDKSIVVAETRPGEVTRYHLLEMVRQFAREELEAAGGAPARLNKRHWQYFLDLAQANAVKLLSKDRPTWLKRFLADHDNLELALDNAFEDHDDVEAGFRLALAMQPRWLWRDRGESVGWMARGMERLEAGASIAPELQAAFFTWASMSRWNERQVVSRGWAEHGLALSRGLGPEHAEILCWSLWMMAIGGCYMEISKQYWAEAEALLDEQEAVIAMLRPDTWIEARIYKGYNRWLRAVLANYRADHDRARALSLEALSLFEDGGPNVHEVSPLIALGDTALRAGNYDQARTYFVQLMARTEVADLRYGDILTLLCETDFRSGNLRKALDSCKAFSLYDMTDETYIPLQYVEVAARICTRAGQPQAAARLSAAAEAESERLGRPNSALTSRESYWGDWRFRLSDLSLDDLVPDWRTRPDGEAIRQAWKEGRSMNVAQLKVYMASLVI
jgi:non-specific serine/threonine protein kinase